MGLLVEGGDDHRERRGWGFVVGRHVSPAIGPEVLLVDPPLIPTGTAQFRLGSSGTPPPPAAAPALPATPALPPLPELLPLVPAVPLEATAPPLPASALGAPLTQNLRTA